MSEANTFYMSARHRSDLCQFPLGAEQTSPLLEFPPLLGGSTNLGNAYPPSHVGGGRG